MVCTETSGSGGHSFTLEIFQNDLEDVNGLKRVTTFFDLYILA